MARSRSLVAGFKTAVILVVVLVAAALGTMAVDCTFRYAAGPPPDRTFATVPEAERDLGERLALPAFFPDTLRWPPSTIRVVGLRPAAVLLGFTGRQGGAERLYLAQTVGGDGPLDAVLSEARLIETSETSVGSAPATLDRLRGHDGALWYQLTWRREDRKLVMRSRGALEQLLRMASSIRREGPSRSGP